MLYYTYIIPTIKIRINNYYPFPRINNYYPRNSNSKFDESFSFEKSVATDVLPM